VYVLDWGLARVLHADDDAAHAGSEASCPEPAPGLTLAGEVLGTPGYMAPEQARASTVDARADVHALGAVLYECLCGRRPYAPASGEHPAAETLERLRTGPPEDVALLAPAVPAELAAITRRALERDPARRYASVPALAADLRAYLEGRVVGAHARGPLAELKKWIARNRALAVTLVLAAVAVIAGGVFRARAAASARDAESRGLVLARRQLLDELATIRHPERAQQVSLFPPAGNDAVAAVSPAEATNVLADHDRYVTSLERHGAAELADLERFFEGAPPQARDALLDELYWFELRLVPASLVESRPDAERIRARRAELDRLVLTRETRPWRIALRGAWERRLAGDAAAFDAFVTAAGMERASAEELEWLSVLLSSLGDERLQSVLERLLALDPGSFWGHFRLATLVAGEERLVHAYAATALEPSSMQAWYNLGWNHQHITTPPFGDPDEAVRCYRRALELDPTPWQTVINLSYLVPIEEAIELIERTLELAPAGVLYHRLAERWRAAGDCEQAIEVAREGAARFPDEPGIWGILGECLVWSRRFDEAVEPLERAIALDPGLRAGRSNLCFALANLLDAEDDPARKRAVAEHALAAARAADERWPDDPAFLEYLGFACVHAGRFEDGVAHLIRSLELGTSSARETLLQVRDLVGAQPGLAALVAEIDAATGE
jgi:tetratricopeptide (TPR) repeat protein